MNLKNHYPSIEWKHCPYCGSTNIEWKNVTHYMQCVNCSRVFYINASASVVAIIYNSDKEILLTHRKYDPFKGSTDLPGGFVNPGETAENALIREVKEELNITIDKYQYKFSSPNRYLYNNIIYFTLDLVFKCFVNDISNIKAADDISDYFFQKLSEIQLNDIKLESIRNIVYLEQVNSGIKNESICGENIGWF